MSYINKNESTYSTCSSEGKPLTLEGLKKAISTIEKYKPSDTDLGKIIHNLTEKQFEQIFGKPINDPRMLLWGIPVFEREYWPKGLMTMVDRNGNIIQSFKFE